MTPPNNTQKKWIALAVVVLFILSGGIYQMRNRQGRDAEQSGAKDSTSAQTGSTENTTAGSPSTASTTETSTESGDTETTTEITKTENVTPTETKEGSAEKPSTGGLFAGLFGSKKTAPTGTAPTSAAEGQGSGSATGAVTGAIGAAAGGVASKLGAVGAPGTPSVPGVPSVPTTGATLPGGASSGTSVSADGKQTAMAPAPAVPQDSCFTVTYHHKTSSSHPDEESCSHHKNWLKLKHANINSKSVCVRVNGTPVHYLAVKGKPDEVIFGAVAGPKAKVTVRYCTGKATDCGGALAIKEDCTVPKDEFMEAIGGSDGSKGDARLGQWDPNSPSAREADVMAKLDGAVKRELETNDELNGRAPNKDMYKDWISDNESPACGTQQARND